MASTLSDFLCHFVNKLNLEYQAALSDLTEEQLYHRVNDRTCHIAFHAWHWLRSEDGVINFVLQERKPPVWLRQGLDTQWGLPKVAQGTGMSQAEAHALRVPSVQALVQYAQDVHADVMGYLESASPEELFSVTEMKPFGIQPKLQHIGQGVLTHGPFHLGQIQAMRAVQGLPGDEG